MSLELSGKVYAALVHDDWSCFPEGVQQIVDAVKSLESELKNASTLLEESKLDDYSRGRADAEVEYRENQSTIRELIENLKEDDREKEKDYHGKPELSNRIMRSYYSGKASAFYEVIAIFDFMKIATEEM